MKTINVAIVVDGHKFKLQPKSTSKNCESCGMGYEAYLNLKTTCRNFIDVRALGHELVDKYLDAGGDPKMLTVFQEDFAKLMEKK